MRTVLIGSDFMYDKNGNLKPIELNTNVGWDGPEKVEEDIDCLDFTSLDVVIKSNNFTIIHYIGDLDIFNRKLQTYCVDNSITYEFHAVGKTAITIPHIEDDASTLIIRSAYDTTALVDDQYCRDKVNFLNLIKDSSFGSQFVYKDDITDTLVSNINTINDNGEHPNFLLKPRYPGYDKSLYPKFFKVTTQSELDYIISNNVTIDYFLMEYLYNPSHIWEGHMVVVRSLNLVMPPNLESIPLGQYTKLNQNKLLENVLYDPITFEVDPQFKSSYTTVAPLNWLPKLLDTDMVEMSDGTFKTALELQIGDVIKTIEIPNENGLNIRDFISSNDGLTYDTLLSTTVYSSNTVIYKQKVDALTFINTLIFEDGSTWEDTMGSRYMLSRNGMITFESMFDILVGDVILLLDTTDNDVKFVEKTVVSNKQYKRIFSGWFITVDKASLFLTKTSSTNNESYVSVEANVGEPCNLGSCPCYTVCPACPKASPYCSGGGCVNNSC